MDYSSYKTLADKYIIEKYGTTDVLKVYNKDVTEKLHKYMLAEMLKGVPQNGNEIKKVMSDCKKYDKLYIDYYRNQM